MNSIFCHTETPLPALSAAALNPAGNLLAPEEDSLESWDGFLLAVPKKRTTNLKKKKRRWLSIHQNDNCTPKENIVECPKCGHWNESHTLCGKIHHLAMDAGLVAWNRCQTFEIYLGRIR